MENSVTTSKSTDLKLPAVKTDPESSSQEVVSTGSSFYFPFSGDSSGGAGQQDNGLGLFDDKNGEVMQSFLKEVSQCQVEELPSLMNLQLLDNQQIGQEKHHRNSWTTAGSHEFVQPVNSMVNGPFMTPGSYGTHGSHLSAVGAPMTTNVATKQGQFVTTPVCPTQAQSASHWMANPASTMMPCLVPNQWPPTVAQNTLRVPFIESAQARAAALVEAARIVNDSSRSLLWKRAGCANASEDGLKSSKRRKSCLSPTSSASKDKEDGQFLDDQSTSSTETDTAEGRELALKMKNRMAAKLCREKKKEYIRILEERVEELEEQNRVLRINLLLRY
eukprot:gene10948-12109_t